MISEKLWLHSAMASPKLFNIVKIYCFPFRHVIIMLHVRLAKPSIGFSWFYRIAINSPPSTTSLSKLQCSWSFKLICTVYFFSGFPTHSLQRCIWQNLQLVFVVLRRINKLAAIHGKSIKVKVIVNF